MRPLGVAMLTTAIASALTYLSAGIWVMHTGSEKFFPSFHSRAYRSPDFGV